MATTIAASGHRMRCDSGRNPASPEEWQWVDAWIAAAIAGRNAAVDAAIGRRDAALRELAARYYRGSGTSAQARTIRRLASHYAATSWRRDRRLAAPPAHYADSPHELLWRAFAAGAPMPVSERRLRGILRAPAPQARGHARARVAAGGPTVAAML